MLTLASEVGTPAEPSGAEKDTGRPRRSPADLLAVLAYLIGGLYVTARLWTDLDRRVQTSNIQDHGFFQFVLAHAAHSVVHLQNPLFTAQVNVPMGVNMMANTSMLGLAIPLTPVTLLFGANFSYALLLVLALAGTATAWYWVLSRHVVKSRIAAFVAAGFCGFAPGFVSQANGHPNVVAQFMVPLILWQVVRLRDSTRPVRDGVILGLLITYQVFVNEEVLLFTAAAGALMAAVWGLSDRSAFRRSIRSGAIGLASGAAVALVLLAYPFWFQFFGPQHYGAVPALSVTYYSDMGSYFNYATESIAGAASTEIGLHAHRAEENAYFGWPLLILCLVTAVWLWRNVLVRVAVAVAVVFGALSLGPRIKVYGHDVGIPGPFRLINHLPVLESVVPVRMAMMVVPALGLLLAFALDRLITAPRRAGSPTVLWYAAVVAALLPIAPTPLPAKDLPATPAFVADGTWRRYVPAGRTVVPMPLPNIGHLEGQRWSAQQNLDMPIPGGYFLGPSGTSSPRALYGAPPRPTAILLDNVGRTGQVPTVTAADRQLAVEDLRFWRAAVVIIGPVSHADAVLATVRQLLGEPQFVDGVWLWNVSQ